MEEFLAKYWVAVLFIIGVIVKLSKLYIENIMLKFSKLIAEEMALKIAKLSKITEEHHANVELKITEVRNAFEVDIRRIDGEIGYIKSHYKKDH